MEDEVFKNEEDNLDDFIIPEFSIKQKCKLSFWKKMIIFGIILFTWITIMIIELVIVFSEKKKGDNRIGVFTCIYEILDHTQNISLVSENFNTSSNYKIEIDDSIYIQKNPNFYKFKFPGNHTVKFILYDEINMDNMFKNITDLVSIDMKSEKNAKITSMISVFEGCQNLKSFKIKGFNLTEVKSMRSLFADCPIEINDSIFENLNTEYVEDMSYMFYNGQFKEFNISNFNTNNAKNMSHIFNNCIYATFFNFSFNTINLIDISYMFSECFSIKEIDFTNLDVSNVQNMSHLFHLCKSLENIHFSENFDTSNVLDMSYMFEDCTALHDIDINKFNTSKVIDMSFMFYRCTNLQEINVSNFDTSQVISMENMFGACLISNLDLTNFDTSNVKNMSNMFGNCGFLSNINLYNFDTSKVEDMSGMFYFCSG